MGCWNLSCFGAQEGHPHTPHCSCALPTAPQPLPAAGDFLGGEAGLASLMGFFMDSSSAS